MIIGRSADQSALVVAHATVSRRHARITLSGDELWVVDLGSMNGSWIDGRRLQPGVPVALQPGSTIRLGDVKLLVQQV
jgi:pSer/pThr/pTyr-binding forkhead associated (FHA) protein